MTEERYGICQNGPVALVCLIFARMVLVPAIHVFAAVPVAKTWMPAQAQPRRSSKRNRAAAWVSCGLAIKPPLAKISGVVSSSAGSAAAGTTPALPRRRVEVHGLLESRFAAGA
jgi:hypothetical protein